MAVQTHQPPNVLHLKRINEQEMNPPGFGVADQSSVLISNIGGYENPRKRARDGAVMNGANQLLLMQSQPSILRPQKLIRLDQLQQSQNPAMVSTGLQLASGKQNLSHNGNKMNYAISSSPSSNSLCEDFAGSVGQYSKELDQLLQAQGEQLRQALAERQAAHYRQLLLAAERSASHLLRKKQTELDRLVHQSAEFLNQIAQLQSESLAWQSKAIASQNTASSLHAQIQHVMAAANAAALAGGNCSESPVEDAESSCADPNRGSHDGKLLCRACRNQTVSVIVLPCRHLCLCEDCDAGGVAEVCPVCERAGNGSVRVFLC